MSSKPPYSFIDSKRSNRPKGIYLVGSLAVVLILVGAYLTFTWLSTGGIGSIALFASDTPTPTDTLTPSTIPTQTTTPSITPTGTEIPTSTASAPFLYEVQTGDTLSSIADQFGVEFIIIMALNGLNNDSVLFVGQQMVIPDPNTGLPEPTPLPEVISRGTEIEYLVLPGDSIGSIAEAFLSTEDAIIDTNELDNPNSIFVGQLLRIPVNLVTPIPTTPVTPTVEIELSTEAANETPTSTSTP
jgi:LysM repeat protein